MTQISKLDPHITLEFLQTALEDQYFERKGIEDSGLKPTKLANEIIGMLNADGGVIVLGVSDTGDIQDLNTLNPNLLEQYECVCIEYIKPPANVTLEKVVLPDGKLIFLYHIEQDYERLFSRKDPGNEDVYLRIGSRNKGPLNRDEVRKLEYDKSIRQFEEELREDFNPDDFRKSVLELYSKRMNFTGTIVELMLKRNLAVRKEGAIIYKNAAILLFAEDPDMYIPSSWVRYIRYNGTEAKSGSEYNVIKDEEFRGCIPQLIETIKHFLDAGLRDYYYLDISKGKFEKISEYPEDAWLEGLVNALCHRSYNIQGNPVYIKQFDDRIEISNSGPLPAQVTVETIREERFSRNPRIARVLADMGYVRELNEGVKRIFESMERSMLSEPEYYDKNNTVTLILRNNIADHSATISDATMARIERILSSLSPTEVEIVQFLFTKHQATIEDFMEHIDKTETAIRSALNKLIDLNILVKNTEKQRDKNAIYTFKKS